MPDAVGTEKTQIEIPYGIVEYTAVFKRPIFSAWANLAGFSAVVLDALSPYGFTIDGMEAKTHSEKLTENAIVFRHPTAPVVTFSVGLAKTTVMAENLDWAEAEQFLATATAGLEALKQAANPDIQSQHVALGIHVQLKTKSRKEVTAPLLGPAAFDLLDGDIQSQGIILQRQKCSIIIDASLAYANGLFIRILREHAPDASLPDIAGVLRKDEEHVFQVLGLEGNL
ncbi:MAG: hypothetical protein ABSG52_03390 [Terriglobales bacterium]|jgi:hypothetical protein